MPAIHGVQALWGKKTSTEEWGFLLLDAKNALTRSMESEFCGWRHTYVHPELVLFSTTVVTGHCSFFGTGTGKKLLYIVEWA